MPLLRGFLRASRHCLEIPGRWRGPSEESFYDTTVESYAKLPPRKIPLADLLLLNEDCARPGEAGDKALTSMAELIRSELCIRFSHTLRSFQILPYIIGINPHIHALYINYFDSFHMVRKLGAVETFEDAKQFASVLSGLMVRHQDVISQISAGLYEVRTKLPSSVHRYIHFNELNHFLDALLLDRMSRRVLAGNYMSLMSLRDNPLGGWSGAFCTQCSPTHILEVCCEQVRRLADEHYGIEPPGYEVIRRIPPGGIPLGDQSLCTHEGLHAACRVKPSHSGVTAFTARPLSATDSTFRPDVPDMEPLNVTRVPYSSECKRSPLLSDEARKEGHIVYIPAHLEYVLVELLKNAYGASIQQHDPRRHCTPEQQQELKAAAAAVSRLPRHAVRRRDVSSINRIPAIVCRVFEGSDVTVVIRDVGGGVPLSNMDKIFEYGWSTNQFVEDETQYAVQFRA